MSYDEAEWTTYTHPSGIFSIEIPADWNIRDESRTGMVLVNFVSADATVLTRLAISAMPEDDSDEAYVAELQRFITETSGGESNFAMDEWEVYEDDTIGISYSYELNGASFFGDASVWYDEPYAVMFLAAQPEDMYEDLEDLIIDIADSLEVDTSVALP